MGFFQDYWWIFLIFTVIVATANIGLYIGIKSNSKTKIIERIEEQKKDEAEQKEKTEQKAE